VVAARALLSQSGLADLISVTDAGRLRCYGEEFEAAQFLAMSEDEALDALLSASIRAELGDDLET
jgi:hypothetical protein